MANDSIPAERLGTLSATVHRPHAVIADGPTGTRGTATNSAFTVGLGEPTADGVTYEIYML